MHGGTQGFIFSHPSTSALSRRPPGGWTHVSLLTVRLMKGKTWFSFLHYKTLSFLSTCWYMWRGSIWWGRGEGGDGGHQRDRGWGWSLRTRPYSSIHLLFLPPPPMPVNCSLFSCIFFDTSITLSVPQILSFLTLSSFVTPHIHLRILISVTFSFFSCIFFIAHVSDPLLLYKSYLLTLHLFIYHTTLLTPFFQVPPSCLLSMLYFRV